MNRSTSARLSLFVSRCSSVSSFLSSSLDLQPMAALSAQSLLIVEKYGKKTCIASSTQSPSSFWYMIAWPTGWICSLDIYLLQPPKILAPAAPSARFGSTCFCNTRVKWASNVAPPHDAGRRTSLKTPSKVLIAVFEAPVCYIPLSLLDALSAFQCYRVAYVEQHCFAVAYAY